MNLFYSPLNLTERLRTRRAAEEEREAVKKICFSFLVVAGLSIQATACAAPEAPAPSVEEAALQPQHGGTFYLTVRSKPSHLHPFADSTTANSITTGPVFETLLKYDYTGDFRDEFKVLPNLAERWERSDPTTYLFHLRKGIKFNDGSDFTSEDAAWSLEYLRDPANKFRRAPVLADMDKAVAVDPYTLRVTTKGPSPVFIDRITNRNPVMLSKKAFDRGVNFEQEAIGTGPFKLTTWDRTGGANLIKNDAYWQSGQPYLDKIQFFYNFDFSGSIAAFTAGKNDVVKVSNQLEFDQIKALNPGVRGESFNQNNATSMIFRMDRPPFNDVRVRRALHLAIDRNEMNETLASGLARLNAPGVNPGHPWAIPQSELATLPGYRKAKDQDLAEAKRLLAGAGYANGLRFVFQYNTSSTRRDPESQMVSAQLKKIGVNMELKPTEDAVARKAEADGDFESTFATFDYDPDGSPWRDWLHSKIGKGRTGLDDRELDRLIEAQGVEMDTEKRKGLWRAVQQRVLDNLYVVPLISQEGFIAYQPYVHGWGDNRAGQAVNLSWESTWLEVDKVPPGR